MGGGVTILAFSCVRKPSVVYRFMEDRRMQKKGESSMVLHKHTRLTPIQRKEIYRLYIDEGYCYLKFDERGSKYLPINVVLNPNALKNSFIFHKIF